MTRRSLVLLAVLAVAFLAAHAGLAASAFSEELEPSFVCQFAEVVIYIAAAIVVWRDRSDDPDSARRAVIFVVATATVLRLMLLFGSPDSTDINRYVWDGRVQGAGINPYVYIPADPALKFLRDDDIYPEINRADYAPTIYPPAAQALFFAITRISDSLTVMKAAMVLFEAIAVWAMLRLMSARAIPAKRILLYLWHPLPIWEFAGGGHVDAAAICCVMLALLAAERKRFVLVGLAFGSAIMVKFLPVVLGPALYRRWDWRLPAIGAATIVLFYWPYLGAGSKIFGFLNGYAGEEGMRDGSGLYLWLLARHILPVPAETFRFFYPAAAVVLALLGLRIVFARQRRGVDLAGALLLAEAFTALASPHYPWYFAWLVPFLCFIRSWGVVYVTCMSTLIYMLDWPPDFIGGSILFGPFLVLLSIEATRYCLAKDGGAPSIG